MENTYLDMLGKIYANTPVHVVITDKEYNVLWQNESSGQHYLGNFIRFFGNISDIPSHSGAYSGTLDGMPYTYNILFLQNDEKEYIVIELITSNFLTNLFDNALIQNYFTNFTAEIRQSIFGISNAASVIYSILDESEEYNELEYVNVLMNNSYRILRTISKPSEAFKYINNAFESKVFSISNFFEGFKSSFDQIFINCNDSLSVSIEKGIYFDGSEERLCQAVLSAITALLKSSVGKNKIGISLTTINSDIMISISNYAVVDFLDRHRNASMIQEYDHSNSFDFDLFILQLFAQKYDGQLFFKTNSKKEAAIGIRIPSAAAPQIEINLNSDGEEYVYNKFSPLHVAFAGIFEFDYY